VLKKMQSMVFPAWRRGSLWVEVYGEGRQAGCDRDDEQFRNP